MDNITGFGGILIGFFSYPVCKWLMFAIWDKMCADLESVKLPGND